MLRRKEEDKNGNVRKRNGHKQRVVGNISRLPNWNLRKNSLNSIQVRFNLPFESSRVLKRESVLRTEGKKKKLNDEGGREPLDSIQFTGR